ncbi:hypothetical protein HELRODRAFT_83318, partial [Helobdella robusta]|uniref:PX domain-containing protein n=1 Tax=Helobdella robusta TaxID=6412 RepID=T1G542_HELRO
IYRRYHEFYVLENKLKEFHGEFDDCQLPAKKTFVPKSKIFFENLRTEFESFLRILLSKPNLRGSQLVYGFLTSNQEFTTSFLDVNLGLLMKSGAMKLVREKGQHLEPFLKTFLQSTESSKSKSRLVNWLIDLPYAIVDSNTMFTGDGDEDADDREDDYDAGNGGSAPSEKCFVDNITSYFDSLLYLCNSIYESPDWLMQLFLSLRMLLRNTIDTYLDWYLNRKLQQALTEHYVVKIIHLLRDAIFYDTDPPRSEEDKKKRQKEAFKDLLNYIPNVFVRVVGSEKHKKGTKLLFDVLQRPRLNKHLSYTLLDAVLEELFPELLADGEVSSGPAEEDDEQKLSQVNHLARNDNQFDLRKRTLKSC